MGEEEGEAGARSLPAMKKRSLRAMEGEPAGARSMSRKQAEAEREPRSWPATRRSARVRRIKELSGASEEHRILHLKEIDDLNDLRDEVDRRHTRHQNLIFTTEDGKKILPSDSDDVPAEEAAGKEEKMKVLKEVVPQGLIEFYKRNPPYNPEFTESVLRKRSQHFREIYVIKKAIAQKTWEYQQELVKQFRTKGYALDYTGVEEDDEEQEDDDEEHDKN